MPFKSEAQRKWMHATHPEMANQWEKETPKKAKLPTKLGQIPFGKETEDYYDDLSKSQMRMVKNEERRNPKMKGMSRNEIAYKLYPKVGNQGTKAMPQNPFLKAFEDAATHNSQNENKSTFHITYKKLNGRTVKRKVDPGTVRNGLVIAYDHKRKATRSFKIDRIKDMKKVAYFYAKAPGDTHYQVNQYINEDGPANPISPSELKKFREYKKSKPGDKIYTEFENRLGGGNNMKKIANYDHGFESFESFLGTQVPHRYENLSKEEKKHLKSKYNEFKKHYIEDAKKDYQLARKELSPAELKQRTGLDSKVLGTGLGAMGMFGGMALGGVTSGALKLLGKNKSNVPYTALGGALGGLGGGLYGAIAGKKWSKDQIKKEQEKARDLTEKEWVRQSMQQDFLNKYPTTESLYGLDKTASFLYSFIKAAGLSDHLAHGAELAGLGILAAPSVKHMVTGKDMSEKNKSRTELAGLGVLAAPSVAHFAHGFLNKAKKAI